MTGTRSRRRVLRLASTGASSGSTDRPAWPAHVDLVHDAAGRWTVGLGEGVGHGSAGGEFSVDEALQVRRLAHISRADGAWLVPFLRRLQAGGTVTESELVTAYRARHGRDPQILA
ncbi:hypothetical protein [Litorihabitans aurantiacus]|uniref:Uncharacterized protein n=1 Tax=Litorihabitans aurantiacus TaxID=1930061 RepID=A0AA37XFL6_9MICO|nr:hypothetical protein [Litorihabitans aurantiacus]GMA32343.1 hypothetical protein GCM10025875_23350 [Litorihabitans aurantiacus]